MTGKTTMSFNPRATKMRSTQDLPPLKHKRGPVSAYADTFKSNDPTVSIRSGSDLQRSELQQSIEKPPRYEAAKVPSSRGSNTMEEYQSIELEDQAREKMQEEMKEEVALEDMETER